MHITKWMTDGGVNCDRSIIHQAKNKLKYVEFVIPFIIFNYKKYDNYLIIGVRKPSSQFRGAAELLEEIESVGPVPPVLVQVGHGTEQGTKDYLGVILNKVKPLEKFKC